MMLFFMISLQLKQFSIFIRSFRQKKYELGIVPSTVKVSTTSHIINFLSGAKQRVGVRSIDGVKNPASSLLNIKCRFLLD